MTLANSLGEFENKLKVLKGILTWGNKSNTCELHKLCTCWRNGKVSIVTYGRCDRVKLDFEVFLTL